MLLVACNMFLYAWIFGQVGEETWHNLVKLLHLCLEYDKQKVEHIGRLRYDGGQMGAHVALVLDDTGKQQVLFVGK